MMIRPWLCGWLLLAGVGAGLGQTNRVPLEQRRWFEARSAHFNIYSCAPLPDVYGLSAHLEQFCDAYTMLAGARAVASPPIIVMAFPDRATMKPYLPLYEGQPANFGAFFKRGSDENLIVLALPGTNAAFAGMEVIFHEYTHLLFRRQAAIWPMWLNEGTAELYSTFETQGRTVRIGKPIDREVQLLRAKGIQPLRELFTVTRESPQYNERDRQGRFYGTSWLLTHFLMTGDRPVYRAGFGRFLQLLHEGWVPEQAFTNAMGISLSAMDNELRGYLARGRFATIQLALPADVTAVSAPVTRGVAPEEIRFRLGKELMAVDRFDAAESCFKQAQKIAPASPLPFEGLGLLAAKRGRHEEAVRQLREALQRGSDSFLAHYSYAQQKYRLTEDPQGRYSRLEGREAVELRAELGRAIALMPDFAPAHELFGFFELAQGDNLAAAEQQLELAIRLEPENPSYMLTLAQAQLRNHKPDAARRTLAPLLLPHADATLRAHAEELMRELGRDPRGQ